MKAEPEVRNISFEVEFVPGGTSVPVDVGGGWARRTLTTDHFKMIYPAVHGDAGYIGYVPVELLEEAYQKYVEKINVNDSAEAKEGEDVQSQ